jgi:diguanylate cyclase (GGDEF)-like protein
MTSPLPATNRQAQINSQKIMGLFSQDLSLPSPPTVAVKILNAVNQDEDALSKLGEIIATDPALTVKLLKIANSCIFRGNTAVNNINKAIPLLGTNIIKNIALSFVICDQFNKGNEPFFNFNLFWQRSIVTAVAAEKLNKLTSHNNEDIYISALLLHLGMIIIAQAKGLEYKNLCRDARLVEKKLEEAELEHYGYSHFQVTYALLQNWNIPREICELILLHPSPEQIPEKLKKSSAILNYAEQIASICMDSEVALKARLLTEELNRELGIGTDQIHELYDQVATDSKQILTDFELETTQMHAYSDLLQQANLELSKLNFSNEQLILELTETRAKSDRLACELFKANSQLRELAYCDALTGLYNHRYFHESLAIELSRAARYHSSFSLLLFDIDHFKKVNDSLGHQAGDRVLANVAKAINKGLRPSDLIARYGGDEFAVILPETDKAGAKVFAARLRRGVEGIATLIDDQEIHITISIGICSISNPSDQVSKESIIAAADKGLYLSKQNGRNKMTLTELCPSDPDKKH